MESILNKQASCEEILIEEHSKPQIDDLQFKINKKYFTEDKLKGTDEKSAISSSLEQSELNHLYNMAKRNQLPIFSITPEKQYLKSDLCDSEAK